MLEPGQVCLRLRQLGFQAVGLGLVFRPAGDLLIPHLGLAALFAQQRLALTKGVLGARLEIVVGAELEDLGQHALALDGRAGGEAVGVTLLDERRAGERLVAHAQRALDQPLGLD